MRCPVAHGLVLTLALAVVLGACTKKEPAMPATCTDTRSDGYVKALHAAPGPVRLPGGTPISECLRRVRTDAELQNLGLIVFAAADELATRARDGRNAAAARELGYLTGAVRAGAARSNGISAELSHRVEGSGRGLDEVSAAISRALQEGLVAGRARG